MKKKIVILDYEMGNLFSVKNAFLSFGAETIISSNKAVIAAADAVILPGVGAFGQAMDNLRRLDLVDIFSDFCKSGKPVLGICLGLQLLFDESEEFGNSKGLGLVPGTVKKFDQGSGRSLKVPHIGWNEILRLDRTDTDMLQEMNNDAMYFVHSYYVNPKSADAVLTTTNYNGFIFCSSIQINNIFACQFHPEKSGKKGLNIFKNWYDKVVT